MSPLRPAFALALSLAAGPALACAWQPPLDLTAAPFADMIFEARLVAYAPYHLPDNPPVIPYAVATFAVTDAIVGDPPAEVAVLMLDNLTGVPDRWHWDDVVIVATVAPGTSDTAWSGYHNPLPDLPVLLHPTCGTPFIAPATEETRAGIARALGHK